LQLLLLGKYEYPIFPSFSVLSAHLRKQLGGLSEITYKKFKGARIVTQQNPCLLQPGVRYSAVQFLLRR
jgi:hypothetical protein